MLAEIGVPLAIIAVTKIDKLHEAESERADPRACGGTFELDEDQDDSVQRRDRRRAATVELAEALVSLLEQPDWRTV